jgi:ribose transport system permease protein
MTAAMSSPVARRSIPGSVIVAFARRNAWTLGLLALLIVLFAYTKFLQPRYSAQGVQGLAISVMPLAFAAVAQAIVVISGGIDLSIGSLMALTNVVAAVLMKDQSAEAGFAIVIGVLLLGLVLGAVNGGLVVLTRVPDIVVTLAMSFVWAGAALLVLKTPGGGAVKWLKDLVLGSIGNDWIPKAAIVLLVVVAVVWLPIRRSRFGLSLYAVGSNQLAAFRSGVSVGRTKILAYSLMGLFAAFAGLSLTANTGIGNPLSGSYTLQSVAAIVLGGVSLAGGRGGIFGPLLAVVILQFVRTDMTFLNLNPNFAVVAQGIILIGVVMVGTLFQMRRSRA